MMNDWISGHWIESRDEFICAAHRAPLVRWSTQRPSLVGSLMVSGPPSIGKSTLAIQIARSLLCNGGPRSAVGNDCACDSCTMLQKGIHPDLLVVGFDEEAHSITIDEVRAMIDQCSQSSWSNAGRVALIIGADRMNANASNSLLKTLEEPRKGIHIILTTSNRYRLPSTIRSRLPSVTLPKFSLKHLRNNQYRNASAVTNELVHCSWGCPGRLLRLSRSPRQFEDALHTQRAVRKLLEARIASPPMHPWSLFDTMDRMELGAWMMTLQQELAQTSATASVQTIVEVIRSVECSLRQIHRNASQESITSILLSTI